MPNAWTPSLSVGIDLIDIQHRQLLERLGALTYAIQQGSEAQELLTLSAFLEEYVIFHFATEETYMQNLNYPGFEQHCQEHAHYTRLVESLTARLKNTHLTPISLAAYAAEVQKTLVDWFLTHIEILDKNATAYLLRQAPKTPTSSAKT